MHRKSSEINSEEKILGPILWSKEKVIMKLDSKEKVIMKLDSRAQYTINYLSKK